MTPLKELILNTTTNGNFDAAFRKIHEDEERQREQAEADKSAAGIVITLSASSVNHNPPSAAELVAAMRVLNYTPATLVHFRETDIAYRKLRDEYGLLAEQRAEASRLEAEVAKCWTAWETTRSAFFAARDLSIRTAQLPEKLRALAKEARELFAFERGELPELLADSIG